MLAGIPNKYDTPCTLAHCMLGLAKLLLIGLFIALALGVVAIINRLRRPPRRTYASAVARRLPGDPSELAPPTGPRDFRAFSFDASADRLGRGTIRLPAWEIPGDSPSGPVIICTPGWGDSKLGVLTRLSALLPHASRIIAWDPAGLGESPPESRCNLGTEADVAALCALVQAACAPTSEASDESPQASSPRPQAPLPPPLLLGWSLGAGVSIAAATRLAKSGDAPIGVIAEAPYRMAITPARNVLRQARLPHSGLLPLAFAWLGWRLRGTTDWSAFDRAALAAEVTCPILVIHGTLDAVCPHEDGQRIAAAAQRGLLISVEDAGHNDLWTLPKFAEQCAFATGDFIRALRP